MRRWSCGFAPLWLAVLLPLAGCGGDGPTKAHVKGTVTLDGQPLAKGSILFVSADKKLPSSSGTIKDGTYEAEVYVGPMQVQILSPRVVGKRKRYDSPDSPLVDVTEEAIPARYNAQSKLTADVKPGEQTLDFPLKRK